MKAYRIVEWGRPAEFVDVPVPSPAAGEVLIRMRGAGLCRSDLDIMDSRPGVPPYADVLPAGFTLGHENAGIVEMAGEGVTDLKPGDGVVVHHMRSCGYCDFCHHGHEQSCRTFARGAIGMTRGVGFDGGLAEFLVVPRHELVALGALDPVQVAPLTDAGVTSYHAVKTVLDRLYPGTVAVVIGLGGLGAYAVQFLKLLSPATVFGVDRTPGRLEDGKRYGADHCIASDERTAETIMDLTGGRGADAIIDIVGTDATLALASAISRPHGRIVLVGMEGGSLNVGWGSMATTCEFAVSLGSSRADLREVCNLAAQGKLVIDLERFAFDDLEAGFAKLRAGQLRGRAVVTFD
ncbi:NAD(P)-dependent alcohol dehydrogenase [Tsuneonella sp. CC-YZS046]|uniref:NAD(P)-dependent alcohol dehydrogenase n=1 Tax=Tsuneonella sp. CC-YZS046 TaxID=3042152 RepID=UPI002D773EF2|nr:NAD(P)-dependent alcohol dehydrogenase [Tsuneonella sp. CC-YZS046]WRO66365.1 NAD(P)-dependent alcohol dehydrogenase [Tsuneonella sp. CC-YZS046]